MIKEIWRDVVGYEGVYEVSNMGRIKSLSRDILHGSYFYRRKELILKTPADSRGYSECRLCNGITCKLFKVHVVVAASFLNHKTNGHIIVIDHINGNKEDNRLENLQLVTQRENTSICFNKNRDKFSNKYIGVTWYEKTNKWICRIHYDKKTRHLGYFNSEIEASNTYQNAILNIKNGTFEKHMESIKRKKTSEFKGVSLCRETNKWRVFVQINKKQTSIGSYNTEQEASNAYQVALKKLKL